MFVIKRNGDVVPMDFEKIHRRINWLVKEPYVLENVNGTELTQRVIQGLKDNIKTSDIDIYTADLSSSLGATHLEYLTLAGRIAINNHHKNTLNSFKDKIYLLYRKKDSRGNNCPSVSTQFYKYVLKNQTEIDKYINYDRDYLLDFFGFKTLEKGYLLHIDGKIIERPQDLIMRVAIQLHMPRETFLYKDAHYLNKIFEVYDMMSQQYYTHATPTLFNAGAPRPQCSSCFLMSSDDSVEGIMGTASKAAIISKYAGGIGMHIDWRGTGALIKGTNGTSSGVVPFLSIYNATMRAFNQGGKRNGSCAIYLEMHHPDLMGFLDLKKAHGDENLRCRDLFLALWIPDLFMKRMEQNVKWSLFDPDECPGLNESYGEEYENLYLEYEKKGLAKQTLHIQDILESITDSQMEKGVPYILYKDHSNKNSMQKNIGVIRSSNLCVSGDTLILTDKGYFPIKELTEVEIPVHKVWNGDQWSDATFAKTGENKELLEIVVEVSYNMVDFDEEKVIKCTPYHKFILNDTDSTEIEAQDLKIDDYLKIWYDPTTKLNCYSRVKSIKKLEKLEDTYCFNEPLNHRGIFNGLLLGNCTEVILHSDADHTACCNLSSICLSKFVEDSYTEEETKHEIKRVLNHEFPVNPKFDFKKLARVSAQITENLNNVIDKTWNPVIETARSNFKNRPIGIGIQGLADVFMKFRYPFESPEAAKLNKAIAEAIYYGSLSKSTELCRIYYQNIISKFDKSNELKELNDSNESNESNEFNDSGDSKERCVKTYLYPKDIVRQYPLLKKENVVLTFKSPEEVPKTVGAYYTYNKVNKNGEEAPIKTKFHWELYGLDKNDLCGLFDWETLRDHINIYGVRNSTVTAYMPTASTSQIMGNSSCFEPYMTNLYKRKTLAGYFTIINKYLMNDLVKANLWNRQMKDYLLENEGSIQNLEGVPQEIKNLYKTVWDIKQKTLIDLAADRQPFVDQSQSLNLYLKEYNSNICASIMMYGWKKGLKTGSYYIRVPPALEAQKFTVNVKNEKLKIENFNISYNKNKVILKEDDEEEEFCLLCSS